ncbi:uncharacterized protein LOC141829911 [Curcuma longa]|uniref:uncharacterized protein LOC141829911 n=1 Tax=Curcuma longa TaxID=136217 RepID=UPI003D9F2926
MLAAASRLAALLLAAWPRGCWPLAAAAASPWPVAALVGGCWSRRVVGTGCASYASYWPCRLLTIVFAFTICVDDCESWAIPHAALAADRAPPAALAASGPVPPAPDLLHFLPLSVAALTVQGFPRANATDADRARPASYAAMLCSTSPRASKKTLEDVGDDFKPATIYINDKLGIFYTKEEVGGMAKPFRFALIGKFSGMRPKQQIVLQAFQNLGLSGFYNIRFLHSGYIFMHLTTSEDMAIIWTRRIWYIGGVPLRIFKWTPNFSYTSESSVVPMWIQLPDLPIHMFNKRGLFLAAKIVGNPIKLDEATADCSRLTMARVCVEIDLLKPKVEEFWIGIGEEKILQKVIYERVPNYCMKCLHLGHSEEECYANGNRPKPQWKARKDDATKGGEDLRVILNRRDAAGKEKEIANEPLDARDEPLKKNGGDQ